MPEDIFYEKIILITGGTGSFGREFVKTVLKNHQPKAVRVFSRDELKQFQMQQSFKDKRMRYFLGDVRDKERLYRALQGVDIVVHAAAMKQIPACEYDPFEAIKTNILGTANVIDVAIDNNVEKVMFISTDKAVNPVNLYGATKLCAEKLIIRAGYYVSGRKTLFSCTRYGNVLGSRGSVVPLFLKQKKEGVLTITDFRMTRFWISLEQGVDFVIKSIAKMQGGEVFIPKIPSMKIIDLAKAIVPEAEIKEIGIRLGEKLHEVLLTGNEARHSKEFDKHFIVEPEPFHQERENRGGKPLPDDFRYGSDNNDWWLTKEELKKILEDL